MSLPTPQSIDEIVERHLDELVTVRRHLHAFPELSWRENETTAYLESRLSSYGISSKRGPRSKGLVVDLGSIAPVVGIRGDIDAIPVEENTGLSYKSRSPGVMHACGHDVHATVLLGTLVTLDELHKNGSLDRRVSIRGIFQPAEEVAQGAGEVIGLGWLDGLRAIFGYHVDPSREVGRVGLKSGVQTAFCDEISIEVTGEGGHSARPHETDDPILASVQLISALYGQLPRKIDSRTPVVLSITRVAGGSTSNIIPGEVKIGGTLRALDIESLTTARETIHRVATGIATATGTKIQVLIDSKCPGVVNDPAIIECFREVCNSIIGSDSVDSIRASIGGEDFAFYTQKIPGALLRIGCGSETAGYHDLHSPHFTVDERAIKIAIKILVSGLIRWSMNSTGQEAGLAEQS